MAKLTIKRQRIFADFASYVAQFGSMAAGAKANTTDLDTIQSLDAWTDGFSAAVTANGPPALEDLNGFFYVLSKQLAYFLQTGIAEWNSSPTYYLNSMVNNGADTIFMSGIDDNTNNALTDGAKWINYISRKVTTINSLDYNVVNNDYFIICTATPTDTNKTIYLPTPSVGNIGREIKIKQTGVISGFNLAVSVTGGSTIDGASASSIAQYTTRKFVCNGTNWFVN